MVAMNFYLLALAIEHRGVDWMGDSKGSHKWKSFCQKIEDKLRQHLWALFRGKYGSA